MPIVQPIDGAMLIQALRTGQQDRMSFERARAEQEQMRANMENKKRAVGIAEQMFNGAPQGLVAQATAAPQTGMTAPPPQTGMVAPQEGAAPMQAPLRAPNPNLMAQLVALDRDMAESIATTFKSMSEIDIKRSEQKNAIMAAAARTLANVPENERGQMLQTIAPQLIQAGWTQQEIAQANLSDQGLRMLEATSIDLDNLIDNELAEREFQAGKVLSIAPGGIGARVRPEGPTEIIAAPSGFGGQQPIAKEVDGVTYYINPATGDVYDNPEEAMGGTAGNGGGGF